MATNDISDVEEFEAWWQYNMMLLRACVVGGVGWQIKILIFT